MFIYLLSSDGFNLTFENPKQHLKAKTIKTSFKSIFVLQQQQ